MIRAPALSALALGALAACASAPAPAADAPAEVVYLDDATFKPIANAAYYEDTYDAREAAFSALLARNDLTTDQIAETYMLRGLIRGVYVNDGLFASPWCAVEDFAKFDELASPEHPRRAQLEEARTYQMSRYQYFTEPETCE
ncbi:MAG: hypothetical protein KDA53_13425 [Hyphomonas sp.]|nr:hypothetical protein [Hyphomonas sp.]